VRDRNLAADPVSLIAANGVVIATLHAIVNGRTLANIPANTATRSCAALTNHAANLAGPIFPHATALILADGAIHPVATSFVSIVGFNVLIWNLNRIRNLDVINDLSFDIAINVLGQRSSDIL
jgi:hypothetical protein